MGSCIHNCVGPLPVSPGAVRRVRELNFIEEPKIRAAGRRSHVQPCPHTDVPRPSTLNLPARNSGRPSLP